MKRAMREVPTAPARGQVAEEVFKTKSRPDARDQVSAWYDIGGLEWVISFALSSGGGKHRTTERRNGLINPQGEYVLEALNLTDWRAWVDGRVNAP
jgi:hypothetical protein